MAAITALQTYGSSDSEDDSDSEPQTVSADATAHLRPLDSGSDVQSIQKRLQINAAPLVETKVSMVSLSLFLILRSPRLLRGSPLRSAPQSPLQSAWAFVYLYSEGLHRILCGLAKFTFLFTYDDHKSLYMPKKWLWYVIISPNSI